jgi:Family of unknown function (DUF6174)
MRFTALSLLAFTSLACGQPTAPSRDDVIAHHASWSTHGLTKYSYVYEETGYFICCTEGQQIRLVVINSVVASAVFLATSQPVPGSPSSFPTIDALFERAAQAAGVKALSAITYDPVFDYPTRIDLAGPPDASGSVFASDLQPLP